MFERFTDHSFQVTRRMQGETAAMGHRRIATPHLLLGIVSEGDNPAQALLEIHGLTLDEMRETVEGLVGVKPPYTGTSFTYSKNCLEALRAGVESATELGVTHVAPEHLLLGLLGGRDYGALFVLKAHEVDPMALREDMLTHLRQR